MNALVEYPHFTDTTATSAAGRYTTFTPRAQAEFLASLQLFGNVRVACRSASVSSQTAYRARRASAGLARAWDAALLAARAHAEAALADRALNGVEEAVYYHGEEVARRRRYDSRLLLAHLARLDRLEERADLVAELGALDARIDALRSGVSPAEALPDHPSYSAQAGERDLRQDRAPCAPSCGEGARDDARRDGAKRAEGQAGDRFAGLACDCVGARYGTDEGAPHYRMGPDGPEPVVNSDGKGPCCDRPDWPGCRDCPHYPPVSRVLEGMEWDRPDDAPTPHEQALDLRAAHALAVEAAQAGGAACGSAEKASGEASGAEALAEPLDADEIEALQMAAYEAGVPEWWTLTDAGALQTALDALEDEDGNEGEREEARPTLQ